MILSYSNCAAALAIAAAMTAGNTVHAATIDATLTQVSGNTWDASFSVGAATGQTVDAFSVYFDWARVSNILVQASPGSWDSIAIQADSGLASDGYFDALALGTGIAPGASLGGFVARFDWAQAGGPATLRYTINDPLTFDSLEAGAVNVTTGGASGSVPEPGTVGLVLTALIASAATRLRRAAQPPAAA